MKVKDLLQLLDLGSSVAEFDDALEKYFVETPTMRILVEDKADIIAGDKGTGKTALYRILSKRYAGIPELNNVEVLAGFNPTGNPVFQRLTEGDALEEGQYVTIWKAYVLALVGNWILQIYESDYTGRMHELQDLLRKTGLLSADDSPGTIFAQLVNLYRRITTPKAAEVSMTITPHGIPLVVPRVEFEEPKLAEREEAIVRHDEALGLLNQVLDDVGVSAWVVLDRLDEAFQGFPAAEVPALRALLRAYLDLAAFPRVRLKLFLRKDLFRRLIEGGFVNLTHVNARKVEIVWDEEDLRHLLGKRIAENRPFLDAMGVGDKDYEEMFDLLFPPKVDPAEHKPTAWNWMMARIRDGNDIKPPRNLIDLVKKAQEAQLRRENRSESEYNGPPIIHPESIRRGLAALSAERVNDTLLAEAGEHTALIERFRGGKAEHSEESVAQVLGVDLGQAREAIKVLREIGFLEVVGTSYKVPMLYRQGLGITQGKAHAPGEAVPAPTDDDD